MKVVLAAVPNTVLLVVGEGPDREVFHQEAERLGIARRVIWKGRVEPEALPQYYGIMDVLAMPSHWEGFGLTAAEAMAAAVPVVGAAVPGLREVIEDGETGFLVPTDDEEALADRLIHLLGDDGERERLGLAGLRRVRQLFDVPAVRDRWLEAYACLLGSDGA
jgi:glycosyltransferase involved in cell wall biosynthesis